MNTHKRLDIYTDFANNLWEEPRDLEQKETDQCLLGTYRIDVRFALVARHEGEMKP